MQRSTLNPACLNIKTAVRPCQCDRQTHKSVPTVVSYGLSRLLGLPKLWCLAFSSRNAQRRMRESCTPLPSTVRECKSGFYTRGSLASTAPRYLLCSERLSSYPVARRRTHTCAHSGPNSRPQLDKTLEETVARSWTC